MENKIMNDVIKGVFYDRGTGVQNGELRYFTLIAMVVASTEALVTKHEPECVVMGQCDLTEQLKKLVKYECPYKFGDISHAIIDVSQMVPDDLVEL